MKKLAFLSIALCFYFFSTAQQSIEFASPVKLFDHHTAGLFALAYIPMDYNQDGVIDYIGRGDNSDLIVHLGTDSGFEKSEDIAVPPFIYARPYDIIDFDKDGFEDIIMEGYVYVYDPMNAEYNALFFSDTNDYMHTVMGVADFDGNGYNDLLTVLSSGSKQNDLSIYYYDGVDFEQEMLTDAIGIGPLRVGDLESDGDMDIAIIDKYNTATPVILVNDGLGNFTTRYVQDPELIHNRVLDFEDMDSDGDLDLLIFNINHELIIYENFDNYMSPPTRYLVENGARSMSNVISDLNGDGMKEIISFNITHDDFTIDLYTGNNGLNYSNKTQLAFLEGPTFFLGLNPNYDQNTLRLRNVDGDGDMDLILSFSAGADPSVYLFENLTNNGFGAGTSITDNTLLNTISLYPNPVVNDLFIDGEFTDQTYSILDINGQVINRGQFTNSINVADIPEGAYLLQIKGEDGLKSSQFMKVEK